MKIYIAGKITDLPEQEYTARFMLAEAWLQEQGHETVSPICLSELPFSHSQFLEICKVMIKHCDAVYFLDNWQDSKGALEEYAYAGALGKKLMFEGRELK